ncbi:GATA zinc finger domain-containing protein 10 [Scaptodrosophila lebanonensis]|uniref:GATA zinc finger domain-containing protein 10 n=1 Tax=Drosophila lebanonensis TaxID=7225 RepID=A0A6J2TWN9_DROLE|nr:GATA zinc finger domain-containing protein 10 [Scaptodrosophila lebanonensis]
MSRTANANDMDTNASKLQYAAEDAEDVDADDESEAADIILESQRPTSKNFTVYLAGNSNNNKEATKKCHNKSSSNNSNNGNNNAATKSTSVDGNGGSFGDDDDDDNNNVDGEEQEDNVDVDVDVDVDMDVDASSDANNVGSKSFAYKKFKNMHEQQNQQKRKEQQLNQEPKVKPKQLPPSEEQLFDSIEILNERKFNKAMAAQSTQHQQLQLQQEDEEEVDSMTVRQQQQRQQQQQQQQQYADIMAIGDIEDNFGNDEVLAESIKSTIDNDESAKTTTSIAAAARPTTTATLQTTTNTGIAATSSTTPSTSTTISSVLDGPRNPQPQQQQQNMAKAITSNYNKNNNKNNDDEGSVAVAPAADDANENNDDMDSINMGELHYYDGNSRHGHARKSQANYLSSYFGHTINDTQVHPKHERQQQPAASFLDDEYVEEHHQHQQQQHQSPSAFHYHQDATESPSAFERFKALRRSNRRNGHKSHKKRYKDYLRNGLDSSSKLKLKLQHAAPIFALGTRGSQQEQQQQQQQEQKQRITPKPFYEGQITYYEQAGDSVASNDETISSSGHNIERMIATDNSNWYRRVSPVLRNGIQRAPLQQQLGHQITEMEELERYYAKWPHLARVQFQVYDEHYRESHPELYADYDADDEDYETAAELEEAQQEHGAEANLPPYIKKYNRRNKQLLNLLEGTLPPATQTPPLRASWSVRLDDDYLKQKRRRYHSHKPSQYADLFSQQRQQQQQQQQTETTTLAAPVPTSSVNDVLLHNQLPDEQEQLDMSAAVDFWQKEIESKSNANANEMNGSPQMSWKVERGTVASTVAPPAATSSPKPALFKLPSYPAIADSFMGTPRSRSRSAQFVSNVSGRGQGWRYAADPDADGNGATDATANAGSTPEPHAAPPVQRALNSFVYHRVVDASPRLVGVSSLSNRKQRLPFVAITDRRLETSKKLLAERHKDFEQNHFPMP